MNQCPRCLKYTATEGAHTCAPSPMLMAMHREIAVLRKIAEAANKVPITYHDQYPCYTELKDALREWKEMK